MSNVTILADFGTWVTKVVWGCCQQTALQLLCLFAPFVVIAMLLHWLERVVQLPLARRFGWRSVLWTGWLGTPVHELSHAALCIVFRHRIEEMALFKPDLQAGRMGYVLHAYNRRNPYQVVGNFFIGLAPLAGGTVVLYLLLRLFYPLAARQAFAVDDFTQPMSQGHLIDTFSTFGRLALDVLWHVVTIDHLLSIWFWLFLYLALCIGSHMAPSGSDYRGATWGGLLLLGMLVVLNMVYLACGGEPGRPLSVAAPIFGPALALFSLCAVLCSIAATVVVVWTKLLSLIFGNR